MDALFHSILLYSKDVIMLVEILSLLLVVFFVFLLHLYARCFLVQAPITSDGVSSASAPVVPLVLGARLYRLHNFFTANSIDINNNHDLSHATKGLESSVIFTIPQFVFRAQEQQGLVCIICLSLFGDGEVGKKLALCGHAFHVECIDMWLHSHTTCPICRAPAARLAIDHSDNNIDMNSPVPYHDIDRNYDGFGESSDARQSVLRNLSQLEIIVEVPEAYNEPDDTVQRNIHKPSNVCSSS